MKRLKLIEKTMLGILFLTLVGSMASCKNETGCTDPNALNYDPNAEEDCCCAYAPADNNENNVIVTSNITANTTWTNDKVYQLANRISVEDGATLTIEAGTIIKAEAGTGSNATALIIARGAKLIAEGTASEPIIFTSIADEIAPGQIASPNLVADVNGLWGGLIVLGKAPISASASEIQIEGIPTSDQNGLYGGNDPADNSGVLRYISIRHGGANIGQGNEINGLTLGGVGSATTIENIEVVANQDDGIEWFGGSVNVTNAIVWNAGDDGIDTDQSWSGTLDNFIVLSPTGHCFELDGPEGSMEAGHIIKNGTVVASDPILGRQAEDLINVDENSIVSLENIFITNIVGGQLINRVTASEVDFSNIYLNVPQAELQDHVNGAVPAGVTAGGTTKANAAAFSWTWASAANQLSGL